MIKNMLLLSIVIPIYNVEKYIETCLNSIYEQHTDETLFEVILVNDGTKDLSAEIAKRIIKSHPNTKLITQENQGLSIARNTGLACAKGEYVWFVDSDDWLKSGALNVVLPLIKTGKYDMITMPLDWSYQNTKLNHQDIKINSDRVLSGMEYQNCDFPTGAVQRNIIRRSLLTEYDIKFFPHILHEDALFGGEVFYLAKSIYVLKSSYYNYRQREEGSIMHSITIRSAEDLLTVHKELMKFAHRYVSSKDIIWFRTRQIQVLFGPYFLCWDLRNTKQFKDFKNRTRPYRRQECKKCLQGNSFLTKIKIMLCAYAPMLRAYIRIKKERKGR